jgi:CubicO group peptidase (beta-lactamase class C family)
MFRKRLVQGTVHDQGAAMLGGVGGHAGLFSTAGDLAAFMQMYLQKGKFQGKNYFEPETISLFTKPPFTYNRRALGWDRPDKEGISYFPADSLCPNAYGHSGFTGCLVFADPDQQLLFIFLSNRIYPDINTKMVGSHLRRKLLEIIYSAIIKED